LGGVDGGEQVQRCGDGRVARLDASVGKREPAQFAHPGTDGLSLWAAGLGLPDATREQPDGRLPLFLAEALVSGGVAGRGADILDTVTAGEVGRECGA
jgi:hypothetical protein